MNYEDDEVVNGLKINFEGEDDEPLDPPEEINDFGLDEEDPDRDS